LADAENRGCGKPKTLETSASHKIFRPFKLSTKKSGIPEKKMMGKLNQMNTSIVMACHGQSLPTYDEALGP